MTTTTKQELSFAQMLRQILINYRETYNDENHFPRDEHPELWEELDFIEEYLEKGPK